MTNQPIHDRIAYLLAGLLVATYVLTQLTAPQVECLANLLGIAQLIIRDRKP